MRGLAFRRHVEVKKKAKMSKVIKKWRPVTTAAHIGIYAHSPARCSCDICGNPRKHWKRRTLAEKRAIDAMKDE